MIVNNSSIFLTCSQICIPYDYFLINYIPSYQEYVTPFTDTATNKFPDKVSCICFAEISLPVYSQFDVNLTNPINFN